MHFSTGFKKEHHIEYYVKSQGLSKWWFGYNNEPIVIIDDPMQIKDQRKACKCCWDV